MTHTDLLLCDFCADPREPVCWRYPAADFNLPVPDPGPIAGLASSGGWAACDPCRDLIEAGLWHPLAARSARSYAVKYEVPADAILPSIAALHALFRLHQQGGPRPVAR